jgi:hypothetical protein
MESSSEEERLEEGCEHKRRQMENEWLRIVIKTPRNEGEE